MARQWMVDAHRVPVPAPRSGAPIRRRSRLHRPRPLPYLHGVVDGEATIVFYGPGQEFSLPMEALPLIEGLHRTADFVAEDVLRWDPKLSWQAAKELLTELVEGGVLSVDRSNQR
ncbi:MAG: hypothetical protein AAGF12_01925 [Myxococcota bacterium]